MIGMIIEMIMSVWDDDLWGDDVRDVDVFDDDVFDDEVQIMMSGMIIFGIMISLPQNIPP